MRKVRCPVARVSDLTPDVARVVALSDGGECALVWHEGRPYAVGSLCPHQNARFDNAPCERGEIICKRHGYRFDLRTGDCRTIGGYGLPVFETSVEDGVVFVTYWDYEE